MKEKKRENSPLYFLIIASIAANAESDLSLIKIYSSSPGVHLKKLTAA